MNSKIYFIVLIAFALVVRIYAIFELKQNFSNDESVTYLSATGNQVKYAQLVKPDSAYLDNYVKAQVWKNCYVSNPPFCFKKIAYDLTQYDIHPPLFFWLMHLFILLFGFHVYTGLILNLITTLLTLFTLYKFSNYVFNNSFKSLLVCTFWFLSPAIVQTDLEARHYQLFALFTILLSHIILKILNTQRLVKIVKG